MTNGTPGTSFMDSIAIDSTQGRPVRATVRGALKIGAEVASLSDTDTTGGATVHSFTRTTFVVKVGGFSDNPGSKFSGLRDYYPAMFECYEIAGQGVTDYGDTKLLLRSVISFPVTAKKSIRNPK